jgi:hypothetical protein
VGDDPHNSVLVDCHAGLAWNAMWCQSLTAMLVDRFGLAIEPVRDAEVAAFLQTQCASSR